MNLADLANPDNFTLAQFTVQNSISDALQGFTNVPVNLDKGLLEELIRGAIKLGQSQGLS